MIIKFLLSYAMKRVHIHDIVAIFNKLTREYAIVRKVDIEYVLYAAPSEGGREEAKMRLESVL